MKNPAIILLALTALTLLSACEGQECQEPRTPEEIDERVVRTVDEYMDAMDAYPMQREKIDEMVTGLQPDRIKLSRQRAGLKDVFIDQLLTKNPDSKALHKLVDTGRRQSMNYTWKLIDEAYDAHTMFTTEQREGVIELLEEPPDEFSISFIVRRGIDIFLIQIDATAEQKSFFWEEVARLENETNAMIKRNHAIRLAVGHEWVKKDVDKKYVQKQINESADVITSFIHDQVDRTLSIYAQFDDSQKEKMGERLASARTCKPGQKP